MLYTHPQMLYNNLGGFGPGHLDEPPLLRFEKTCVVHGRSVDAVPWKKRLTVVWLKG